MSNYTADTMTPDEVIAAVLKRPALYGLVKLPDREVLARKLYETCWDDLTTWRDDSSLFYDYADAVLALLKGEENE